MTLGEYLDTLNLELLIRRYPNQDNRYIARIAGVDFKDNPDSGVVGSPYGNGTCPATALKDYLPKICGKWLVLDAFDQEKRRMFLVPESLSL
jgi:hypothetical protein